MLLGTPTAKSHELTKHAKLKKFNYMRSFSHKKVGPWHKAKGS